VFASRRVAYGSPLSRRAPPSPSTIFGASLLHHWDLGVATSVTTATGISGLADQVALNADNLAQGAGGDQPAYTAAGQLSKSVGDGTDYLAKSPVAANYSGGITFVLVGKYDVISANLLAGAGTAGSVSAVRFAANATNFLARFTDSSGIDSMVGPLRDTNPHCFVIRNEVGVSRKFYVDGGTGTAGVRTLAGSALTRIAMHGAPDGTLLSQSSIFELLVLSTPALAKLNEFGSYVNTRYSSLGVTWSPAS
jgi:hypothetical protein